MPVVFLSLGLLTLSFSLLSALHRIRALERQVHWLGHDHPWTNTEPRDDCGRCWSEGRIPSVEG